MMKNDLEERVKRIGDFEHWGEPAWMSNGTRDLVDDLWKEIKRLRSLQKPVVVCLCGSTRFMDAFHAAGWEETLKGKIVLSVGVCKHAADHGGEALGPEVAAMLDELHKRKIDLADEVLILNVGGYIGESTRSELDYAVKHCKTIRFLEEPVNLEGEK